MEPIKLEFIVKGDIEKELARVKLAIKGVGDESYSSFKRLLGSSNEAFNGLNRTAQLQAVSLQQVVQQLRQNEAAQDALYEKFKRNALSSKEYAEAQSRLAIQQAELKQQASELNRTIEREIQLSRTVAGSLQEKKNILSRLREEYSKLNKEERESEKIGGRLLTRIRDLDRELKNINRGLKETKTSSGNLTDALEMIPGPIGSGVSQFRQLLSAGKAFMSSGIGVFVAGLASGFFVLKTAIEGSEQGTVKLNAGLAYTKSIFDSQKKMLTQASAAVYNLFSGNAKAAQKNMAMFTTLHMGQTAYAKLNAEAIEKQNEINKLEERNNGLILANASAIEKYRAELMDVNKTFEERKKIGQEILRLEKENASLKIAPIAENYDNFKKTGTLGLQEAASSFPEQTKLAKEYFDTLTKGGELTLGQQRDLINAINDITNGIDSAWSDKQKAQFRSYFTDALAANKEYYTKSREVSTNLSNIIKQQANETARETKKTSLEKLQEEVKLHKEQYDILYAYERNMGKEAADAAFGDLKAKGGDYLAYLSRLIDELQSKPNRTKDDNINLGYLQKTRQEIAPKFDASAFKQSIEEKKKLYDEDLKGYADYLARLRRMMEQDTTPAGSQKRIIIDMATADNKDEQQKRLDELLKNYQTFTTRMVSLDKSYQQDMARLDKAYRTAATDYDKKQYSDAMDARTNAHQAELASLTAENSGFMEVLMGDMERISKAALKKAIADAKKFVAEWRQAAGEVMPEMKALLDNIEQGIAQAEDKSSSDLPQDLRAVATALQDCADMAGVFDEALGSTVQTVADIAKGAADIATGIAMISVNPVQGVASILSGITGIIGGIGKRVQENNKIREEYLRGLAETYSKELEYNSILRERLRLQQQTGETSLEYFSRLQAELTKQKGSVDKEYKEVWSKLMGEDYISGQGYKHGTWFRKAKTWNEYSSLSGKTYEDIESLYTQDKLEGAAKTLFERLQALKDEGANVVDMMDNLKQEIEEAWTGTTAGAITDSVARGLMDGKRSAADFADNFRDLMRDAMMQSIKMKYLEAPLQEWYAKFAEASEAGLTAEKIEELRKQYDAIVDRASKEADAMEKVTGVKLAQDANREAVAKGLQSMSQDSANELNGRFYALQYITANIDKNVSNISALLYQAAEKWVLIEENTRHCKRLETIEKDTGEMKKGISSLVNNGVIMRTR